MAFDYFTTAHGIGIKHYQCNNGHFADKGFINACESKGQLITYCGVNAHFQNGIAKEAIMDIMEADRKVLLHAKMKWPDAVDLALWPCTLQYAMHIHNTAPVVDGKSRLEIFSRSEVG